MFLAGAQLPPPPPVTPFPLYLVARVKCITVSFAFMLFSQSGSGGKSNISELGMVFHGFPQERRVPFPLHRFSPALLGGAVSHRWRAAQCLGEGGSALVGFWVPHLVISGQGCPVSVAGSGLGQSYLLTDSFSFTLTHTFSLI